MVCYYLLRICMISPKQDVDQNPKKAEPKSAISSNIKAAKKVDIDMLAPIFHAFVLIET